MHAHAIATCLWRHVRWPLELLLMLWRLELPLQSLLLLMLLHI
jgi:hypothetical protein